MTNNLKIYLTKSMISFLDAVDKVISFAIKLQERVIFNIIDKRTRRLSFLFPIIMMFIVSIALSYVIAEKSVAEFMPMQDETLNTLQAIFMLLSFFLWLLLKRDELLDENGLWDLNQNNRLKTLLRYIMMVSNFMLTMKLSVSIAILVSTLSGDSKGGRGELSLLWDVYVVWNANILIFATWYWLLDCGKKRHFLFPLQEGNQIDGWNDCWKPNLIDYWFLAFTGSTAFSPTDTTFLSRWSKVFMILQSSLSLVVLTILAARAVNILSS